MEEVKQIDFVKIIKQLIKYRKYFYISLPVAAVLSSLLIICVPRYYVSTASLAPELSSLGNNSISEIASSFGVELGQSMGGSADAILPELYPDIIGSNKFTTDLFNVPIKTKDGTLQTNYYDYLAHHQKRPWWGYITGYIREKLNTDTTKASAEKSVNPFMLTRKQTGIVKAIGKNITCSVDKKNYVISISVEDQDPLICATMTDTVTSRLQQFITDYRTSKARVDVEYAQKLFNEAKANYEAARRDYGAFADANEDLILPSVRGTMEDKENQMQLLYNNYSTMAMQLNAAKSKLQERTPVFTALQTATVPIRPAGPKRMLFVLAVTVLTFIATAIKVMYKE